MKPGDKVQRKGKEKQRYPSSQWTYLDYGEVGTVREIIADSVYCEETGDSPIAIATLEVIEESK